PIWVPSGTCFSCRRWFIGGRMRYLLVVVGLGLLGLVQCGSNSSNAAGLNLSVRRTISPMLVSRIAPSTGNRFLQLSVSMTSSSNHVLSIAFPLFSLQSDKGVLAQSSSLTTTLSSPCNANLSLAPGGTATCDLLFEVSASESWDLLSYEDP